MEGRGGESKGRDGEMRRQGERGEIASWVQGIDARLTAVNKVFLRFGVTQTRWVTKHLVANFLYRS